MAGGTAHTSYICPAPITPVNGFWSYQYRRLINASIVEIKDSGDGVNGSAQGDERERISFAYQKIELTDLDSSTTAIDDWLSPG